MKTKIDRADRYKAVATAEKAYAEATASARETYDAATAPAWKAYKEALALLNLWISRVIFPEHPVVSVLNGLMAFALLLMVAATWPRRIE